MKKVVLIDGNNLLFRSYYATAYTGKIMTNSKGFPTNALYGFTLMINKIIEEEEPEYMVVAFDVGKNFRKEKYDFYKEGRSETPNELKMQMPIARDILDAMGIYHVELAPYEADDIIGTFVDKLEHNEEYYSLIVSSDKDLLQLLSDETEIKLLKQSSYIRYNKESFQKEWGIEPIKIIDLKALMGDASDNIPGVKGIGEKTALKLLQDYKSLDGIYDNIDNIKGKLQEKLISSKEDAYMSYEIATIFKSVPLSINYEDIKYNGANFEKLKKQYEELEFYSLLNNISSKKEAEKKIDYINVNNLEEIELKDDAAFYIECDNENYHMANILGLGITTNDKNYFIPKELVNDAIKLINDKKLYTYDLKKSLILTNLDIKCNFDLMVAAYLLDKPSNIDIYELMGYYNKSVLSFKQLKSNNFENIEEDIIKKSNFIYEFSKILKNSLLEEKQEDIFYNIEMPLISVLANMERAGFKFENNRLMAMKEEVMKRINLLKEQIYDISGEAFNISSPKQLGSILYDKLGIGKNDKSIKNKTDIKTLQKYESDYPIISKILEYRNLTKLQNTYLDTLNDYVLSDGKIHTIFNQTLTRTGRLSSSEPNLQNIPVREELGKKIRMAFIPSYDLILSADYSQIELRILAHISNSKELIEAFKNDEDIHTKVASDIYGINESEVTKHMRSTAKAVIFGIVYGISGFGLGENLQISSKEAKMFIEKYYELYPGVKEYMDNIIKEAYENGYVKTLFGRVRKIDELKDTNFRIRNMGERMALNTPIQGTSADIMKMAMIEIDKRLKKNNLKSKMILQVHDEIIIDAKKEEETILKEIVKDAMENVVKLNVPLKAEINIGSDWYLVK